MHKLNLKVSLTLLALLFSVASHGEEKLTVFAAASLTNALSEVDAQYEKETGVKVVHSFASSSTLAKQIESGAPADVFISADSKWMNYLQDKSLVKKASRANLLGNQLVLIAPKGKTFEVKFNASFDFAKAFEGRLCTGDTESVPAGIYAKESLINLGWWQGVKARVVGAQDVRGALAFVERGECNVGIVYETDAKISSKSELLGAFPEASHISIVYPIALIGKSRNESVAYIAYIKSAPALAIFKNYGFDTSPKP